MDWLGLLPRSCFCTSRRRSGSRGRFWCVRTDVLSFLGHFSHLVVKNMVFLGMSRNIGSIPMDFTRFRAFSSNRPSSPGLGNSCVFISRGKEFGHDVDIIFTTLELGMEENLLLAVIKSLEKQVGPKTFSVCICPSGGGGGLVCCWAEPGSS